MATNDTNHVALVAGGDTASARSGNLGAISLPDMKASALGIIDSMSGP
jgi:hypothetical protein